MPISKELLEILCCSFCKSDLRLEAEKLLCSNAECGLVYAIEDDIPNMLIDDAQRPCPKCSTQRDWQDDVLSCPKCSATLTYQR